MRNDKDGAGGPPSVVRIETASERGESDGRANELPKFQKSLSIQSNQSTESLGKQTKSIRRALISLLSMPSNRSCADCRLALVDPSQVYASFCPLEEHVTEQGVIVSIHDFHHNHETLAPGTYKDPAQFVNQRLGGHGVFICPQCAAAHRLLGESLTVVHPVQDPSVWTIDQARSMQESGGNAHSWNIYEAYVPESWAGRRPTAGSSTQDRLFFCRAKYEALAFALPPPGPLASAAWQSILEHNAYWQRFASTDLKNLHNLTPMKSPSRDDETVKRKDELPDRLVDFFCVVTCSMQLDPKELNRDLSTTKSAKDLLFWPHLSDCFPKQDTHEDMEFPSHLASFVLPDGCRASDSQVTPTFYTFVLTDGDGDRLYGGILRIYDEHIDIEKFRDSVLSSGYTGKLPKFLTEQRSVNDADVVFFPKCLVILSHHGFFDLFREVLLQLYRITLVQAPLPIERYIANIACEVPLPPRGRIKVQCGFTTEQMWTIERPPWNNLPLANFSYRPLFASLSIGNILVLLGCMMQENKVVLLSQHYSMLCPVAEALLGFFFPFTWQGLYIPVMPYAMLDILDAPVPFLVGLHSRYLQETDPKQRPHGVVFVDLDRDVIHLGFDEETGQARLTPALPKKAALKLKAALEKYGDPVYLIPDTGIKGCILTGEGTLLLNEERHPYSAMSHIQVSSESLGRDDVFSMTDKAYDDTDLSGNIVGFRSIQGQLSMSSDADSDTQPQSPQLRGKMKKRKGKLPGFLNKNRKQGSISDYSIALRQSHLLDMTEPDEFSSQELRDAFLRFFVTVFKDYQNCLLTDSGMDLFDEEEFVEDMKSSGGCMDFLQEVLKTQMFQRFLEERKDYPDHPEMRFFDESIIAKKNRSKKKTLQNGGKRKPTPFLDDESGKATKTFTPPPPSNLGLPDDGTTYHYGTFPSFDYSRFGRLRPPMLWPEHSNNSVRQRVTSSMRVRATQMEIVQKATIEPVIPSKNAFYALAKRTAVDLELALKGLSSLGTGSSRPGIKPKTSPSPQSPVKSPSNAASALTKFETFILNARRKQGILLGLIVTIQAYYRMFLLRKKYKRFRRAVLQMQRKFLHAPLVQKEEDSLQYQIRRAVLLQSVARSYLAQFQWQKQLSAVKLIQRWCRGSIVRRNLQAKRHAATFIQAMVRARRTNFQYYLTVNLVSKIQGQVRGLQLRERINTVMERRLFLYRRQILRLWEYSHTPLSFRTKFWPSVSTGTGFVRLAVAEREVIRLWSVLDLSDYENHKDSASKDSFIQQSEENDRLGEIIGIDSLAYVCAMKVHRMSKDELLSDSLPIKIKTALEFEDAERLQIYERIDGLDQNIADLCNQFDIPVKEKKRKKKLAKVIWTKPEHVDQSVSAMNLLFPELETSLNIVFMKPSRKSKRRFPNTQKVSSPPVNRSLWDNASMEARIKLHVSELATILITKVPTLMTKMDETENKKLAGYKRQRLAAMESRALEHWKECRRLLIRSYLAGRFEEKKDTKKAGEVDEPVDVGIEWCLTPENENSLPNNDPLDKYGSNDDLPEMTKTPHNGNDANLHQVTLLEEAKDELTSM